MGISISGGIALGFDYGIKISGSSLPVPPVPGLSLWMRGDDAPNSSGGLAVPLWKDVSGNGNDATQAVVASQPTGLSNQINGHAAVVFDGVNDFLYTPDISVTSSVTIFCVLNRASGGGGSTIIGGNASSGQPFYFVDGDSGEVQALFNNNVSALATGSKAIPESQYEIIDVVIGGGILNYYFNGSVDSQNSGSTAFTSPINQIGTLSGSFFFSGQFAEILIYPTALSDSNRQTVQAYLGTKYAIALGQPQITQADFNGLNGSSFDTSGGAGLGFVLYNETQAWGIWFDDGTQTQPDFSLHGVGNYISISYSHGDDSQGMANRLATGLNGSSSNWTCVNTGGLGFNTACLITANVNRITTDAFDVNTGAAISTLQEGQPNS